MDVIFAATKVKIPKQKDQKHLLQILYRGMGMFVKQ